MIPGYSFRVFKIEALPEYCYLYYFSACFIKTCVVDTKWKRLNVVLPFGVYNK